MIGAPVVRLAEVESTNDAAARLAADGCAEGTVVLADLQRRGRGRQGRPWHSPPAGNLYFSVVLRPARPAREWPELSWVLAAGVAEACRDAGARGVGLKYPNDVMVGGRKLCGLLLETRSGSGGPSALVAGVGLNVNAQPADLPLELRERATSLAVASGRSHDREALFQAVLANLDRWYAAWSRGGAPAAHALLAGAGLASPVGAAPVGALEESAVAGRGGGG